MTIQNNVNIIPLGKEEFINNLGKDKQIEVVNKMYDSIKHLCDLTHFNPATPQYHSFVITNTQNNVAYIYDDKTNSYVSITKKELLFDLFHERGSDVRDFIEVNEEEIRPTIISRVNKFIDRLDTEPLYLKEKGNQLKVYIYNKTKNFDINSLTN